MSSGLRSGVRANDSPNPSSKFFCVWHGSGKQYNANMLWEHDDHLFPNNTSLIGVSFLSIAKVIDFLTSASLT